MVRLDRSCSETGANAAEASAGLGGNPRRQIKCVVKQARIALPRHLAKQREEAAPVFLGSRVLSHIRGEKSGIRSGRDEPLAGTEPIEGIAPVGTVGDRKAVVPDSPNGERLVEEADRARAA